MNKLLFLKKVFVSILLISFVLSFSSCRKKTNEKKNANFDITIEVWNLFDNSTVFDPLFAEFKSKYPGMKIEYRKFEDPSEYLDLIINEMAEGEGPDIWFINNSWISEHYKKLIPADVAYVPAEGFKQTFVGVAADDCIMKDKDGTERVYCMPLYVDNLALYYNKEHFEEKLASEGKPAETWAKLTDQVYKLTKEDKSFERFARSGIALGRSDNISRAYDILMMLFLQTNTKFYNEGYTEAIFAKQQGVSSAGQAYFPAKDAIDLYTSFALPNNKQYSWNKYISNPNSLEKELTPFVLGKSSMMVGYSYTYEEIVRQIEMQSKKGLSTIDVKNIGISEIPQFFGSESGETKVSYASYFAPVVSRTSEYSKLCWELINFLSEKENQAYYNEKTNRPSSRRNLVEEQSGDPIYGVFSKQLGYAKSVKMADSYKYEQIFIEAINEITEKSTKSFDALKEAEDKVNEVLQLNPLVE